MMLAGAGILILLTMYLFQRFDFLSFFAGIVSADPSHIHPYTIFVFNKTLRLIINDLACMILIFAIFRHAKYMKISFLVFIFELLIVLPVYFYLKLSLEGATEISSPLLSQIHRLVVNPMLMILLMAGFGYQQYKHRHS